MLRVSAGFEETGELLSVFREGLNALV